MHRLSARRQASSSAAASWSSLNNQIDTTTGTVQLKGSFANPGHALWPGQYVNVRLVLRPRPARADGARRGRATQPGRHFRLGRRRRRQGAQPAGRGRPDRGRHRGDRAWAGRRRARRRRRPIPSCGRASRSSRGRGPRAGRPALLRRQTERRRGQAARDRRTGAGDEHLGRASSSAPIGTSLLAARVLLVGVAVFPLLPVAPLPQVDFPTIQVSANLPGASPETMASNVAQPLERQFSLIAGRHPDDLDERHRSTQITLQFDLEPQHRRRRAGRPGGDQRRRAASCRTTCRARRPFARSTRPTRRS